MEFQLTAQYIFFLPLLGFAVAALGTVVGLGGGFILVPILIFLFPTASPATITSISLTFILLNTASATLGNIRARRIDMRTAVLLLVGAAPAAEAGSLVAGAISRETFQFLFGLVLILGAGYVLWRARSVLAPTSPEERDPNRHIHERTGTVWRFYVNEVIAALISPIGGFISSLFGIGGGVIHMPAMVFVLKIPTRIASATSLLILVPTSLAAVLTHILVGQYTQGWRRALLLGLGALIGGQLGVYLAPRINQRVMLFVLAAGMAAVGTRQIIARL